MSLCLFVKHLHENGYLVPPTLHFSWTLQFLITSWNSYVWTYIRIIYFSSKSDKVFCMHSDDYLGRKHVEEFEKLEVGILNSHCCSADDAVQREMRHLHQRRQPHFHISICLHWLLQLKKSSNASWRPFPKLKVTNYWRNYI